MKKIKLFILLYSIVFLPISVTAQNYYTPGSEIKISGIPYICYDEGPGVLLYRKSNTLTFTKQVKKDGTPMLVDGEPKNITITPEYFQKVFSTITGRFTAEEKNRAKGDQMIVSMFINSSTGVVMEVNFNLFSLNTGFATIPPERYYQIEQALKQNVKFTPTENGKKYNYILMWIPVKIYNWVK